MAAAPTSTCVDVTKHGELGRRLDRVETLRFEIDAFIHDCVSSEPLYLHI